MTSWWRQAWRNAGVARAAAKAERLPGDPRRWDGLPWWLVVLAGIGLGGVLGWAAIAGGWVLPLGLVMLPLVVWHGVRLRLVITGLSDAGTAELSKEPVQPQMPEPEGPVNGHAVTVEADDGPAGLRPVELPGVTLISLNGGVFMMGADPRADKDAHEDEQPRHQVTLSPFEVMDRPVTRGLYRELMGEGKAAWRGDGRSDLPATDLDWFDALRFCNRLSRQYGLQECYSEQGGEWQWLDRQADGFRLPTEAEWEYACRAGSELAWFWGDKRGAATRYAWYGDNAGGRVQPVAGLQPNDWGLYDMAGNCWEWCWDRFGDYAADDDRDPVGPPSGSWRVLRGGAFYVTPWFLRSAVRRWDDPGVSDWYFGFRCVRGSARSLDPSIP